MGDEKKSASNERFAYAAVAIQEDLSGGQHLVKSDVQRRLDGRPRTLNGLDRIDMLREKVTKMLTMSRSDEIEQSFIKLDDYTLHPCRRSRLLSLLYVSSVDALGSRG